MKITINGEEKHLDGELTIAELVRLLELKTERLAVELNRKIIRRANYASTGLADGDKIEIVHFVGGG